MTQTQNTAPRFIGIFTEDGLDLVAGSTAEKAQHMRDLRAMGCDVAAYEAADESALYAIDDWIRDGVAFATARARVEAGQTLNTDAEAAAEAAPLYAAEDAAEAADKAAEIAAQAAEIARASLEQAEAEAAACDPYHAELEARAAEAGADKAETAGNLLQAALDYARVAAYLERAKGRYCGHYKRAGLQARANAAREYGLARVAAAAATPPALRFNGCDVLAFHRTPAAPATRAGRVMLLQRDCTYEPFVTCWAGQGDSSWCWGHYFADADAARADYEKRCKRGH